MSIYKTVSKRWLIWNHVSACSLRAHSYPSAPIATHQCAQQINLRRPCRYSVCCKGDIDVGLPVRLRPRMHAEFLEKPEGRPARLPLSTELMGWMPPPAGIGV